MKIYILHVYFSTQFYKRTSHESDMTAERHPVLGDPAERAKLDPGGMLHAVHRLSAAGDGAGERGASVHVRVERGATRGHWVGANALAGYRREVRSYAGSRDGCGRGDHGP